MKLIRLLVQTNNRNGISLIEVLAALVVFVIGILTVVRMFPGGFATVRHSENTTIANRLAQAELERWRGRAVNLPAAILPWGHTDPDDPFTVISEADPDNLNNAFIDGNPYLSDVNKFRRIYRETTRVPAPIQNEWGSSSVYVLGFSPIAWSADDTIVVHSGKMRHRSLPRPLTGLRIRSQSQYTIDYDDRDQDGEAAVIYLCTAPYARTYYINYTYWKAVPGGMDMVTVLNQRIDVPATAPSDMSLPYVAVPINDPNDPGTLLKSSPGFQGIDRGSESLHRGFHSLALNDPWSSNPYEYKVANTAVGVLLFNPAGYGYEELTDRGTEPLTAYISYTVLDWHIISEERRLSNVIANAADGNVKLSLRFIKQLGDTSTPDGYPGLSASLPYSVLAVDIETGEIYSDPPGPTGTAFTMNYKEGILTFRPEFAGRSFRIYYKADGDWAVHLYKAYEVYAGTDRQPPDVGRYSIMSDGKVAFSRCYAGCTVAMDIKYRLPGQDEPVRTARGVSYQIPDQFVTIGGGQACLVDPLPALQNLHPGAGPITIVGFSKVYGVSVSSRVIWREAGRGFQAGRWKQKKLQTYLVRETY